MGRSRRSPRKSQSALAALLASALVGAIAAPAVLAGQPAPVVSRGWAGYVAGGRGHLRFKDVSAAWRQPRVLCTPGNPSFSGIWVGLGGFKPTSSAVEQIGTELNCGGSGRTTSGAWYELAPGPAQTIGMPISPGDRMRASVRIARGQAALTLADVTRHETFERLVAVHGPDISSADWIVEAPTGCTGQGDCAQLPLADFGTVRISDARALTEGGLSGSTVSRSWITTKVLMLPDPIPYDPNGTGYAAIPGPAHGEGSAFAVRWLSSGFRFEARRASGGLLREPDWRLQPGGLRKP